MAVSPLFVSPAPPQLVEVVEGPWRKGGKRDFLYDILYKLI
jgi:hypothetical protein